MPELSTLAFISYSRTDSEFALRLAQDLKTAGACVWLDQLDIRPGVPWDNAIETALSDAPQMLLVLSPSSAKSDNVRNEISFALEAGKVIIPVLYMDCTVPLRLQRTQRIDFRADYAHGLTSLLAYLQVKNPDPSVIQKAVEGDAQRQIAWQAREAEAQRLRDINEVRQREDDERSAASAEAFRLAETARLDAQSHSQPKVAPAAPPPAFVAPVPVVPRTPIVPPAPFVQPVTIVPPAPTGLSDPTAAAISYITIFPAILFLMIDPYKRVPFVRFHAIQCLSLAVVMFLGQILLVIIPVLGRFLIVPFELAIIVGWTMCIFNAAKGQWFKLPWIGDFALGKSKV